MKNKESLKQGEGHFVPDLLGHLRMQPKKCAWPNGAAAQGWRPTWRGIDLSYSFWWMDRTDAESIKTIGDKSPNPNSHFPLPSPPLPPTPTVGPFPPHRVPPPPRSSPYLALGGGGGAAPPSHRRRPLRAPSSLDLALGGGDGSSKAAVAAEARRRQAHTPRVSGEVQWLDFCSICVFFSFAVLQFLYFWDWDVTQIGSIFFSWCGLWMIFFSFVLDSDLGYCRPKKFRLPLKIHWNPCTCFN